MVKVAGGVGLVSTVEHRDSKGRLVARQKTTDRWPKYQSWRGRWCERHRNRWAIRGFREGKISPLTLAFAAIIRLQEVLKWH